ncbi:MAG TPA: prepilin peptidase [bacterium]|nr:prepilin peptidase [bacterium]
MDSVYFIFIAIFGLIIGSFLNCLIWRLHTHESLGGRSHCRKCKKMIAWYDNIPVLSFLILKGQCRHCNDKISWQYPIVESITAILFILLFQRVISLYGGIENWQFQAWLTIIRDLIFASALIVVFVTDILWYLIFDEVVIPATIAIGLINLGLGMSWQSLIVSVIIGSGFFLSQFILSRGRWIGGGDIRLGLLLGAAFGWPLVIPAIFIAYILGAFLGGGLLIGGKKKLGSMLPLGTFLAVSALITLFYGNQLLSMYLDLIHYN